MAILFPFQIICRQVEFHANQTPKKTFVIRCLKTYITCLFNVKTGGAGNIVAGSL